MLWDLSTKTHFLSALWGKKIYKENFGFYSFNERGKFAQKNRLRKMDENHKIQQLWNSCSLLTVHLYRTHWPIVHWSEHVQSVGLFDRKNLIFFQLHTLTHSSWLIFVNNFMVFFHSALKHQFLWWPPYELLLELICWNIRWCNCNWYCYVNVFQGYFRLMMNTEHHITS